MAHTPGPWGFNKYGGIGAGEHNLMPLILDSQWAAGYYGFGENRDVPREEMAANARLIAAAPDLLAALKLAVEAIRVFHGLGFSDAAEPGIWALYQQSPEMQIINAALAKATDEAHVPKASTT